MKAIAALAILAVTTVAAPAQQRQTSPQRYDRWCRDMQIIEGSVQYCMAYTLEQCLASRTTPNERCYLNPIYDPRYRR